MNYILKEGNKPAQVKNGSKKDPIFSQYNERKKIKLTKHISVYSEWNASYSKSNKNFALKVDDVYYLLYGKVLFVRRGFKKDLTNDDIMYIKEIIKIGEEFYKTFYEKY